MDSKILEAAERAYKQSVKSHTFQDISHSKFTVVDWKGYYSSRGPKNDVELCCDIPVFCINGHEVGGITVHNPTKEVITFDLMGGNAIYRSKDDKLNECETIAYPKGYNFDDEWVLMMEMKYVKSMGAVMHESLSQPKKMISQIEDTTAFLRDNNIIKNETTVYAAIAFPNFDISAYSEFLFMQLEDDFTSLKKDKQIYMRPSSNVKINSRTDIELI